MVHATALVRRVLSSMRLLLRHKARLVVLLLSTVLLLHTATSRRLITTVELILLEVGHLLPVMLEALSAVAHVTAASVATAAAA